MFKKKEKKENKRKFNLKSIIFIFILLIILTFLIYDKFTLNILDNYLSKYINNKIIKNNPDSLIITVYANTNQIAHIPIINYNKININWGDGTIDEYITYRLNEIDIKNRQEKLKEDNDNIYDNIITPIHKYNKKGKYNIIITGDTNRGLLGYSNHTTTDPFGINMFKKEFYDNIPIYNKEELVNNDNNIDNIDNNENNENNKLINKYIFLHEEILEKNNELQIYNILSFKNLNFKGLGILTEYFSGEINNNWIEKFKNIEIFIETFSNSDITYIPENIFTNSPNLRILSSTFLSCSKLESIPNNLIKDLSLIENVRYCFSNCKNLKANAPDWWNTLTKIKDIKEIDNLPYLLCFNECINLENFNEIPFFWGGIIINDIKEKSK